MNWPAIYITDQNITPYNLQFGFRQKQDTIDNKIILNMIYDLKTKKDDGDYLNMDYLRDTFDDSIHNINDIFIDGISNDLSNDLSNDQAKLDETNKIHSNDEPYIPKDLFKA